MKPLLAIAILATPTAALAHGLSVPHSHPHSSDVASWVLGCVAFVAVLGYAALTRRR